MSRWQNASTAGSRETRPHRVICGGQGTNEVLADTLSEAEVKTLSVKVSDVWANALIDRLPDTLVEVEAETLTRDQKQGPRNKAKHGQCEGPDTGRHGR